MDRRSFLTVAPAAVVAVAVPRMAVAEELPIDRVNRLGWELAEALNDYAGGSMVATIKPTRHEEWAVSFSPTYKWGAI